ncbi:pentatricopeptide repeat-containing protein At5g13270, chloroplastic [Cryptomeria japonica]|uniref:pentatricopeptide repeat-containing protein At5g13270, chloroplastic n=1 Tax=Cryptomeria japonica TaxID=3369 RepID=UPI0027DAA9F8|nr:pentatricopeptide repeat-containing protein At5g13270, chloroplastic [Cryptomeria japonica]
MSAIAHLNQNLRALCREARLKEALHILLTTHNAPVDISTYTQLLYLCVVKKALSEGKQIHSHINHTSLSFTPHAFLQNTLINMYDKCGSLADARRVFNQITQPDVFSWNVIIAAHRRHGFPQQALILFHQMQTTAVQSDQFTFSAILPVCAELASLKHGLQIHGKIARFRLQFNVIVMNTVIDMYVKCGSLKKARDLFDKMNEVDVVSWNAMITGYTQNGDFDEASKLFREMSGRNVVSWTAMITGYVQNGLVGKALEMFKQMQLSGKKPNATTLASILPACAQTGALGQGMEINQKIIESGFLSDAVIANALMDIHAGLVDNGCNYFKSVSDFYCITPTMEHYVCVVDLLARAGHLDEALNFTIKMPVKPNVTVWKCLLSTCRSHRNIRLGKLVATLLIELDPTNAAPYVLLSNLYATAGMWTEVQKLRQLMKYRRIKKIPGCSWI